MLKRRAGRRLTGLACRRAAPTTTTPWRPLTPPGAWERDSRAASRQRRPRQSLLAPGAPQTRARLAIRAGQPPGQQQTQTLRRKGAPQRSWMPGERCCRARGRTMCPARPQSLPWTPLPVPRRPRRTRTGPQQHRQVHPAGVVTACPAGSRPVAAAPLAGLVARLLPGQAGSRTDH